MSRYGVAMCVPTGLLTSLACIAMVSAQETTAAAKRPRPNVVVILADDLGYADVGVQGCKDIPTPNLDRLANEGVRFTAGYAMPWCAPSRHSLITGCWPGRAEAGAKKAGKRIVPAPLPKLFADAGYATAVYGKIHGHDTTGFQDSLGFLGANYKGYRSGEPLKPLVHNGEPFQYDEYMTNLFTRFAVSWITKNKDRPFFLYLPYQAVKIPVPPTAELMKRAGKLPGTRAALAATMIGMDDGVGKVLDALKQHHLEDNTLVFFFSDNGGGDSHSLNTPLRGKKDDLYDGGVRVPFFMRWPAQIKAGKVYDRPVSNVDILVTSLAAAGIPGLEPGSADGVDLLPYLKGEAKGDPHRYLFWDPRVTLRASTGTSAVRSGAWKLVLSPKTKEWELFDVDRDIGETKDVAAEHPDVVKDLSAALERWQQNGKP